MSIIHTIGYEGADIDRFMAALKGAGVTRLIDVRAVAASHKRGFSKKALAARLVEEGIDHRHLVALGDPKPGREAARAGRHALFRRIYRAHLETDAARDGLAEAETLVREHPSCLMCFERDPETCHRSMVTAHLRDSAGFDISNLFVDPPEARVLHPAERLRRRLRQGAAAA